ncbi:hypothetical protein Taro_012730, partial [Colocasia esculenta]|nr:hypothetical protein [Colocasia esculenta]
MGVGLRSPTRVDSFGDRHVPPCHDHAIEAREAERDDVEDEDLVFTTTRSTSSLSFYI